jgi:hypothetical protein
MRTLLAATWALSLLFCSDPSHAAEINFEKRGEAAFITIRGEIDETDVGKFQRLALRTEEAVVILVSPGGSLRPALDIGKIIQKKRYATYAPPGDYCTSACALIWVAGQPRLLSPNSRVGFHAGYTIENGRAIESGVANAMIGRYLTLLNLSEKAIVFATAAAPSSANWLRASDPSVSDMSFEVIEDTSATARASLSLTRDSNPVIARSDFSWRGGGWSVINTNDREGCILYADFDSEGGIANKSSIAISKRRHETEARLSIDNEKFRSLRSGDTYPISIIFRTGQESDTGWGERTFTAIEYTSGGKGLYVSLAYSDLIQDIREEDSVEFFRGGKQIDGYPLKGSAIAVQQLERCLSDGGRHQVQDPFQ